MAKNPLRHSDSSVKKHELPDISLVKTLINSIQNPTHKLILNTCLKTGLKLTELTNLEKQDIKNNTLTTKNSTKIRTIQISDNLKKQLQTHCNLLKQKDKLFPVTEVAIRQLLARYSKSWQIKITTGTLRKLFITNSLKEKSTEDVQQESGLNRLDSKKFLSTDQLKKIKKQIKSRRDSILFSIQLETGFTLKDLLSLKAKDIEFTKDKIKQKMVSRQLSRTLECYLRDNNLSGHDWLFNSFGKPLSDRRVFQLFKKYGLAAGIEGFNPQILKNSHIAIEISRGKSIEILSKELAIKNLDKLHLYADFLKLTNKKFHKESKKSRGERNE